MADVSPVLLEVADGVATVTFNRPDAMNSLDVATKHNPYTRQVDCQTLQTVTPGQTAITPRPVPVDAVTQSGQSLTVDAAGCRLRTWTGTLEGETATV